MLFLGFSAGLPFMLVFSTLSAWLREVGIERATIGMLSWVGIIYSVKFFWAPVVDRLRLPVLAPAARAGGAAGCCSAQVGIAIGLLNMAHMSPVGHLAVVASLALLVAFSSATQDIAVDAWRIEAAPTADAGRDGGRVPARLSHRDDGGQCRRALDCGGPRLDRVLHFDGSLRVHRYRHHAASSASPQRA